MNMLKTNDGRFLAVEELNWADVVTVLAKTNPELAKTMDLLDDDLDCVFYKASYRFGDRIINNGKCYLPLADGRSTTFDDPELPDALLNDLSYDKERKEDPLGLVLSKNSEFYLPGEDGVQTQSIIHPGQMFGIPYAIDDGTNNNATSALDADLNAGSRSLFMLSKISDQNGHGRIQEHYGIASRAPSTPQEHWALFVDIANKSNCEWRSEIIFFPRKWINQLKDDNWAAISKRLTHIHRAAYSIRHKVADIWHKAFTEIERDKSFARYYSMQAIDTARELFELAGNIAYGFKPATNDDSAPMSLIKDAYTNIYDKLAKQKHIPIIMESVKFDIHSKHPIYYSINHSAVTQKDLEASRNKSQIARLDEIQHVEENYTNSILTDKKNIQTLYDVTNDTMFSYYHTNPENYGKINNAALLATEDSRFTNGDCDTFPATSLFFKGCIKISRRTS